jgi:hypothetical protein
MIDEFDLPADIIDRKVTKMKMISPSNREVDVGKTLSETEYIGMCRREVMDDFLRQRAKKNGAKVINSLFMKFERPQGEDGPYKLHFNNYDAGGKVGKPDSIEVSAGNSQPLQMTALFHGNHPGCLPDCHCVAEEHCSCYKLCKCRFSVFKATHCMPLVFTWPLADFRCFASQVDVVIGADGANSRVAKEIDAGEYDYAIAFQERIRIPDEKMDYYKDLAEMYVGDDVSPDFYGWVFPKYDHVAVGTGTVVNKTAIKQYQQATRDRSKV